MPANNLRQADVPEGCHTIAQQPGTAPGLVCPVGAKIIYAVPGVPSEMREMVGGTVIPELAERAGLASVIRSRTLRTWGQSESGLAEMLDARMVELDASGQATLAFLASGMEGIKVRVTVKAADDTAALAVLDSEEAYLRGLLGDLVFGLDEQTMEHAVGEQLARLGWSLALAESLTGGMMATRFSVAAADRFRGALVSALAGLDDGGVSAEALTGEAAAAAVKFGAQVGLAVGFGGRIVGDGPPTSLVRIAMAFPEGGHSTEIRLPGDRERLRQMGTISAFDSLRRQLSAL